MAVAALGLAALERQRAKHDRLVSAEAPRLLRGIIPICAGWTPVEAWACARSSAEFSHRLCTACVERLCPPSRDPER